MPRTIRLSLFSLLITAMASLWLPALAQFDETQNDAGQNDAVEATPAQPSIGASGYPIPRFVSLGVSKANMRVGPSRNHPIKWEYQHRGMPLEVIREHENWRQVREVDGTDGWMHRQLLSGGRTGIIQPDWVSIRDEANDASHILARVQKGKVVRLDSCGPAWCNVEVDDVEGWVEREAIWGIYDHEIFD